LIIQPNTEILPARRSHHPELIELLRTAERAHHHLDWQTTEGWLQRHPCYVTLSDSTPIALLSAPVEPATVPWIRLAAVRDDESDTPTMNTLWAAARVELRQNGFTSAAALTTHYWPEQLLPQWGFAQQGHVVMLRRNRKHQPNISNTAIGIRAATRDDMQAIFAVDQAAFDPPWRYSLWMIGLTLHLAIFTTVAYEGNDIVGYLMASQNNGKVLLARLVVTPVFQNRGVGRALTLDMLQHFAAGTSRVVEVNTQEDNVAAIALYNSLDFELTGEHAQVWHCELNR